MRLNENEISTHRDETDLEDQDRDLILVFKIIFFII